MVEFHYCVLSAFKCLQELLVNLSPFKRNLFTNIRATLLPCLNRTKVWVYMRFDQISYLFKIRSQGLSQSCRQIRFLQFQNGFQQIYNFRVRVHRLEELRSNFQDQCS